ncbi:MAG: 3-deoxy-D-manno-octulosonic acid kinase [Legionellaceae bacterium]|nr:3-deoxy-D-manno-octulosonic acid kinase [Legionellaceae bacterium]
MNDTVTTENLFILKQANSHILTHAELAHKLDTRWFQSSFWEEQANPIHHRGGRGMAWFINSAEGNWVLRHYMRGGQAKRLSKRSYVFMHQKYVRSFQEFYLLHQLFNAGLNVPKPIAARYVKNTYFSYQAEIIIERIPGAQPLADFISEDNNLSLWRQAGALIRQFHDYGVFHADLNCHNILVAESGLYLIDFDKGTLKQGERWKQENLHRLKRSVDKLCGVHAHTLWNSLLAGYYCFPNSA